MLQEHYDHPCVYPSQLSHSQHDQGCCLSRIKQDIVCGRALLRVSLFLVDKYVCLMKLKPIIVCFVT